MINHTFAVLAFETSPYLENCILSIKNQTIKSEIIITTSTPNEYIKEIANKYSIRLYINNRKDIASDWNFPFTKCKTKYLTLAHQDDIYLPEYSEEITGLLEKRSNSLIGFTGYYEIREIKNNDYSVIKPNLNLLVKKLLIRISFKEKNYINDKRAKRFLLMFGNPIPCPSACYNLKKLMNERFSNSFSINLDWDMWERLSAIKGEFINTNKSLLLHRIHSGSETTSGIVSKKRYKEDLRIFLRFWPRYFAKIISLIYSLSYLSNK
ncbi:hypothetical protein SDC9_110658 [bioreactor metagenome]|uniref:Glycosyltransferase 2-like domain-containing protein n=1 Tax=bioreactor metagenome TaxID=1076179 RepID=A0A645BPQ2_9ZZZZ